VSAQLAQNGQSGAKWGNESHALSSTLRVCVSRVLLRAGGIKGPKGKEGHELGNEQRAQNKTGSRGGLAQEGSRMC
jgi:hypothetical protein